MAAGTLVVLPGGEGAGSPLSGTGGALGVGRSWGRRDARSGRPVSRSRAGRPVRR
jgi:hypothetical protein